MGIVANPIGDFLSTWGGGASGQPPAKGPVDSILGGDDKSKPDSTGTGVSGGGPSASSDSGGGMMDTVAKVLPIAMMAFSDKNKKTDIKKSPDIDSILAKVKGGTPKMAAQGGNTNLDLILQMSEEIDKLREQLKGKK